MASVGPWNPQQGPCCTDSCSSGIQAWSPGRRRRRRRRRPRSWSFLIPGGPRTPLGESGRGLGPRQLRPEAGKSLPLEPLRWGQVSDRPTPGSAPGSFWVNRGGAELRPQTWPPKGHLYEAGPASCSAKGSQPPLLVHLPGRLDLGRTQLGPAPHPAKPTCGLPPASPTSSPGAPSLAVLGVPKLLPIAVSRPRPLPGGLSPWQNCSPHTSKTKFWGNVPWVLLGLLVALPPRSWLRTPLSAGTRPVGCPGPGPAWSRPCYSWPLASPWRSDSSTPAAALRPLLPAGTPTTPACTTTGASSALQVRAGSRWGRGDGPGSRSRDGRPLYGLLLLQPRAPTWAESCSSPGATLWTPEWELLCAWWWYTLMPRG